MASQTWDPLFESREADSAIIAAAQKREIKNIIKSYVGMYDSFSELIQNAMDATDRRQRELREADYSRKLWLEIDLQQNSFSITDNGIGFNEKEFKSFLAPNISFKTGEKTRGNKGVGATYIAYGFDYLQFGSKGNGVEFVGELVGGRTWVDDTAGIKTRPVVVSSDAPAKTFAVVNRGSTFKVKFGGANTRPKSLSWYSATTAEQWLYLLLIRTPLGAIDYQNETADSTSIKFDISVIDKTGKSTSLSDVDAAYMYPHEKIKASVSLKEVKSIQKNLLDQGKDASAIPNKYKKSNGLYEFLDNAEIKELRKSDDEFQRLVDEFGVEAYGYFTYSTSVWDQFNDTLAKLRKGYRVLKGGLQLANNKMVQGGMISIPLTSNIGYQNQCHVVVHFKEADPDLGRKGFQPELKGVGEKIAVSLVNRFKKWKRQLLKADTGAKPDIEKEVELHKWITTQESYETDNPLILSNKNFFAPVNEIAITSKPQSEQDVVVLFNQLVAGGVIRGIKLLATSQIKQYDGVFRFEVKEPFSIHEFDREINPLGVAELHFSSELTSPPKILEYKHDLDGLFREFENGEKNEREIHLAVAWKLGSMWRKTHEVTSLLDLENLHLRDFHGLTHILQQGNTNFYAIILEELIDFLNDVDGVQAYHKTEYGDELFGG